MPPDGGDAYMWQTVGRGKRSVVLDLKERSAVEQLASLLDAADVAAIIAALRSGFAVSREAEVTLEAASHTSAEEQVAQMCDRLLANAVIEDYEFTVSEVAKA